ncbi:MAG: hypothetical protein ACWGHO_02635 [Candidatus Moraniibacteriota bacterium]
MKKTIIAVLMGALLVGGGIFYYLNSRQTPASEEQMVLEETLSISKKYVALRYQTDNVLINAKSYTEYTAWNDEMTKIITSWEELERKAGELEKIAHKMAGEKVSFNLIYSARAYDKQEISNIFDKAPAGKKIATLAKHLGVDAKKAFQILKQDQAQVEADAWNEAGDTFQKLESSAVVIKDGCKVAGFVGTIALTGGTAAIATSGTLAQAAVVVSGADLALEVTDDGAKIALGNNNKISAIVGDVRTVTEPAAAILMVATLPSNLTKGIEKLNAVAFGADQLNSSVQSGTVIGIKLPAYTKDAPKQVIEASVLKKEEVSQWMSEQGISDTPETVAEIEKILEASQSPETEATKDEEVEENKAETAAEQSDNGDDDSVAGVWEGLITYTPSQSAKEEQKEYSIILNSDGTIGGSESESFSSWKKEGNSIKLNMNPSEGTGYDEYSLSGDTLTFVKRAGLNSEGEWQEDFPGSDFFGGKFMQISLKKKNGEVSEKE